MHKLKSALVALLTLTAVGAPALALPKIALLGAATSSPTDLKAKLTAINAFDLIDVIDTSLSTPTVQQMKMYDAVLVWSYLTFKDSTAMGNVLADYLDAGGGVIVFAYETYETGSYQLKGRWQTDYQSLTSVSSSSLLKGPVTLGTVNESTSPLLVGVTKLGIAGTSGNHFPGALTKTTSTVVAQWSDGSAAIIRGSSPVSGKPYVELNQYAGSNDNTSSYGWDKTTDVPILIKNAVAYVSGGGGVTANKQSVTFPDQAVGSSSGAQPIVYSNGSQGPLIITGAAITGSNASSFKVSAQNLPATLNPGDTYTANVTFSPLEVGPLTATLEVIVQGQMNGVKTALSGTAIGPTVVLAPNPLNIGGVSTGGSGTATFNITNTGGGTANITKIEVTTDAASFTATPQVMPPFTLAPAASIPVDVKFSSMVTGAHTGVVTVTTNVGTKTVTVQATTGDPQISINNGTVIFGNQHVGVASSPAVFTVKNTGFANLTISDITSTGADAADFQVQAKLPITVLPGDIATYGVAFKPSKVGGEKATITLTSNDPTKGTLSFDVAGSGVDFKTAVSPSMIDYGTVKGGTTSSQAVTVSNMSAAPLGILMAGFTGAQASSFSLLNPPMLPVQVPANGNFVFNVAFKATAGGTSNASFDIVFDDPNKPKVQVALTGKVTSGVIDVAPTSIDFGGIAVGSMSPRKEIMISNKGTDALNVSKIGLSGAKPAFFALEGVPMTTTKLMPGDKLSVFVTYNPTSPGAADAQVDIVSDDPATPNTKVLVKGVGSQPGMSVSPLTLDFKLVPVGTISDGQEVKIENTGDAELKIKTIITSNAQFFVDNKGPFSVPAGKSTTVIVKFNPQAAGSATGDMTITPDSTDLQPVPVSLRGVGASVMANITPMTLTWGIVNVGSQGDAQTVTITNTSQTAITLLPVSSSNAVFVIDKTGMKLDLAPSASTTFTVTFEPKSNGPAQGVITIAITGGKTLGQVTLSGEGLVVNPPPPSSGCTVAGTRPVGGYAALALVGLAALALVVRRRRAR